MLSERIKESTKANHLSVEKKLIANIRSIKSEQEYANLLALFYSYFGGLERAIDKHLDTSYLPDYANRRKTSALVNDLIRLGVPLPALATNGDLPEVTNHYQALGALYVIEGSTLGGQIICKMLRQQMNLTDSSHLSFFNGYGDQTTNMWEEFRQSLDQPAYVPGHDVIIESANQTFIKFGDWFDKNKTKEETN